MGMFYPIYLLYCNVPMRYGNPYKGNERSRIPHFTGDKVVDFISFWMDLFLLL